jgi:2-keto-4-pentenoate hydratase/2-oxohepta-3-ene-1,7-dioic acid hydratase in catechol pathway
MKLLSYLEGEQVRVGLLSADGSRVMRLPVDDMISLIMSGSIPQPTGNGVPLASVRLLAPIPRPRKNVFCVGWNYLEHFEEGKQARPNVEMPQYPTFFTKAPTAVNGPCDQIPYDAHISAMLDWEVELGVVIGRGGKNIAAAEAMDHVFGYTIINDLSWRDIQRRHGQQWFKGKSMDGTCPMGPWIVTGDEIDPANLRIECRVNGVVKQSASTAQMYFKLPRIIAELSLGLTLEPGDIIATGTPSGVGHRRTPPEFMKPGDVMESEIEGIGMLRNAIGS